ncbi:MAG: fused MFS/spermidine synthase [Verrucomicrobiales bacterium]|nr:fused MFS/spermidine synthase [Verrucomicrobiales bacterium]
MRASSTKLTLVTLCLLSLLSAFLLFQVQPVISKFILPWFGGSPGVWTTCMLFFQTVLFAGYAYAHALTRLPLRWQALVHGLLVLAACVLLPISPAETWKPEGTEDPALRILLLLLATVGLPYFMLSSTSPLVQVWFTRAVPGGRPWRLYALSNVGSLAALLTYPFFFEVRWDVRQQTWGWSVGFVLFALLTVLVLWRDRQGADSALSPADEVVEKEAPSWGRRLAWLLLPALGSVLLLAGTNHVCQDVAVIPFLWVVPLSLYLLTFILCFESDRIYQPALAAVLAVAAALAAVFYPEWKEADMGFRMELAVSFGAVFFGCMLCHGELVRLKPAASRLTEFYLVMSAGGALGGLLVSQLATRLFDRYLEWPLALMALLLLAVLVAARPAFGLKSTQARWAVPVALLALGGYGVWRMALQALEDDERIVRARNFYGAISVYEGYDDATEQPYRYLYYGGIIHGLQNLGDGYRTEPVSYYGRHTGIGRALRTLEGKTDARVGVIGMGTASAVVYGQSGQHWTFYEINPQIYEVAREYFTYLDDFEARGGELEVVMGDARLALERAPSQQFDVLLLDAFSGDSVPVHLLTREAFEIYQRHMKPGGIIVVHCTNRYLALASVALKAAQSLGYHTTRIGTDEDGDHEITDYVLLTHDEAFLQANPPESPFAEIELDVPEWTDRRHNLFEILEKE